jgi:hypothetical protein
VDGRDKLGHDDKSAGLTPISQLDIDDDEEKPGFIEWS